MAKTKTIDPEDVLQAIQSWDTQALVQHQYKVGDILNERKAKLLETQAQTEEELKTITQAQAQK